MYEIGPYLRAALKQRGMTQKELARAMGMTKEHISTLCLNKRRPSLDTLEKMCRILGMSYSEFFTNQNNSRTVSLTDNEYSLLCDYRDLDGIERQAVSRLTATLRSGQPKRTQETRDEYVSIPLKYMDSTRYLIVKAKGDSMEPDIRDGDYIVVEANGVPDQGEMSLVDVAAPRAVPEYIIGKFYRREDQVEIRCLNAKYDPMSYPISKIKSAQRVVYVIPKAKCTEGSY